MFNTPSSYDDKQEKDTGVGLKQLRAVSRVTRGITVSRGSDDSQDTNPIVIRYGHQPTCEYGAIDILERHFGALFMLLRQRLAGECVLDNTQILEVALEYMEEFVDLLVILEIIDSFDEYFG